MADIASKITPQFVGYALDADRIDAGSTLAPQEWKDFQFAFTLRRGEEDVAVIGIGWDGSVSLIPSASTVAALAAGGLIDGAALTAGVAAGTAPLTASIKLNADSQAALTLATARARREGLNTQSYGEPETLVVSAAGVDRLLRQVFEDGTHYIPGGMQLDPPSLVQEWRDYLFALTLKRGTDLVSPLAIGWDGLLELYPNDATYGRIKTWLANNGGGGNGYQPLAVLRGDYSAYPARVWPIGTKAGQVVAQVQDRGGQTYRAFERVAGTTNLAVIEGPAKLGVAVYVGQSNMGKAGDDITLDQRAHFPSTSISFAGRNQLHGDALWSAQAPQTECAPLRNLGTDGQLPMVATEFALAQFRCDAGIQQRGTFAFTAWRGSTALQNLDKGGNTYNYQNSMDMLTSAKALVQVHERTGIAVERIFLVQGENSPSANGWQADFAAYQANYAADIPAVTDQAAKPQWFIAQTNTVTGQYNSNCLAQNAVHDAGAAIMTSSRINIPLSADDKIHDTALGRLKAGDQDAHAMMCFERDGEWNPPRERSVSLAGTTLTLRVQLPRDTTAFGKVLDRHSPPQQPQDGFAVAYDGGNTIAINAIAYAIDPATGQGVVTLQLAAAPTPGTNARLKYGDHFETEFVAGATTDPPMYASRTGNVQAPQSQRSFWARAGFDVPRFVHQPLRRFELPIN
jgi:hypothetical protein